MRLNMWLWREESQPHKSQVCGEKIVSPIKVRFVERR
jgi:hypothetical protein